jgi:ribosomal protein L7/L12
MEDTTGASGDIAATTSSSSTASPAASTDSTGSAAPAIQATDANPTTDNTSGGEPPHERWPDILQSARKKEREAALTEWREKYGWAESVPREQLEGMAGWYSKYQDDPAAFLEEAYKETLNHPIHGPTAKSRVGRMLASMRQAPAPQAQPEPTFEPDVPVMNEQGQIVSRTYSADLVKQMLAHEIDKRIQPLKQDYDTRQETAKQAQAREQQQAQAHAQADADVAYVTKRPLFAEHKAEILKVFQENPKLSIREAYDHVMDTKVLPSYGQKAEATVLSDLQRKANAATVNPGTPGGSGQPKFKNFGEAHAYYEAHPEEAAAMAKR